MGRKRAVDPTLESILGAGKDSEASDALIRIVDRPDPRPVRWPRHLGERLRVWPRASPAGIRPESVVRVAKRAYGTAHANGSDLGCPGAG